MFFFAQASENEASPVPKDVRERVDLNPGAIWEKLDSWLDGGTRLLPNFLVALVLFAIFWGVAAFARKAIYKQFGGRDRENLGAVLGSFVRWTILILGFLFAATIVIPSLKPGDLIAGLGVSSVAIGFAFKDILQNWVAGLLILLRQPFVIGDQITVNNFEGTVERIETRATLLKTYSGERVVIPNSDIYTNSVVVHTAFALRRSQYDVGIGYGDDIPAACGVITDALCSVEGVVADPAPECLPWELAGSWVTIRARWWTDSRRTDVVHTKSKVVLAIKNALDSAGIDMPFETQVHLFHDQTESRDGIRGQQREGWPGGNSEVPKSRWQEQKGTNPPPSEKGGVIDSSRTLG